MDWIDIPKEEVLERIKKIRSMGWVHTSRTKNDGAVGNTLEDLLGIPENNLAIANTLDWELKAQRIRTSSLLTLFHLDPQPRKPNTVIAQHLLPNYGWAHKEAGLKYGHNEKSFRQTISGKGFSNRGFKISVNSPRKTLELMFDHNYVDRAIHEEWLMSVKSRVGLGPLDPTPFWTLDELHSKCIGKVRNTIFVLADSRKVNGQEEFYYKEIYLLEDFVFNNFLRGILEGHLYVDFDARIGHNHGTKFRIHTNKWPMFFSRITQV